MFLAIVVYHTAGCIERIKNKGYIPVVGDGGDLEEREDSEAEGKGEDPEVRSRSCPHLSMYQHKS